MARRKKRLSAVLLEQNPEPGKYYDDHGLAAVVGKAGKTRFEQRYTHRGKRRTIPLGRYPELSIADASALALANRRLVRAGQDPVAEKNRPPTLPSPRQFPSSPSFADRAGPTPRREDHHARSGSAHHPRARGTGSSRASCLRSSPPCSSRSWKMHRRRSRGFASSWVSLCTGRS